MTQQLRDAFHDLAEEAGVARVDDRTFARARAVRRRRRGGGAAAGVLALGVVAAGLSGTLRAAPGPVQPAGGDGHGAAVPTRVEALPSHLDQLRSDGSPAPGTERDLAVGRGSVVYSTESGNVVLVGASDGRYHRLALSQLPDQMDIGRIAVSESGPGVVLSPDGRRLAWPWNEKPPVDRPVASGIRVADLRTGRVHTVRLYGGEGVAASALSWSPDGRWLTYRAEVARSWTEGSYSSRERRIERLDTRTWRHVVVFGHAAERPAVDEAGRVSFINGTLRRWDGHRTTVLGRADSVDVGTPDGMGDVGVAGPAGPDGSVPLASYGVGRGLLLKGGARDAWYPLPQDDYPAGGVLRVMGWMDATHPVVLVRKALDASSSHLDGTLLVMGPGGDRVVATVDKAYPDTFSVATDLVRPGHLSREFPGPDWPWSTQRLLLTWGSSAVGLVLLAAVLLRLGRRRTTTP